MTQQPQDDWATAVRFQEGVNDPPPPPKRPDHLWDAPSLLFNAHRNGFTDHSPPSIVEVKNEWSYNSTPPHGFTASTEGILPLPLQLGEVIS